jgi:ubiquinone/menaquinone biosynthesis C-methylase UbiE
MNSVDAQQRKQRDYYAQTAEDYDASHSSENAMAFALFAELLNQLDIRSVLDIGSGTGRALLVAKEHRPDMMIVGIEPSPELRAIGYSKGLSKAELIDGDATKLSLATGSVDLVCEFAALHHIPTPALAVSEMLRVARKAVFISDSNNFGQGNLLARAAKQCINAVGLWPLANFIKTRGRGYDYSKGDGLSYSYSAFNDLPLIRKNCRQVSLHGKYSTSPDVVIIGLK